MNWPWGRKAAPVDVEGAITRAVETTAVRVREELRGEVLAEVRQATQEETGALVRALLAQPPAAYPGTEIGARPGAYKLDNPIYWTTPQPPSRRPGQVVTVETLRRLADTYDVLRSCIQHLKREVMAVPFQIIPRDDSDDSEAVQAERRAAEEWFEVSGGVGGYGKDRKTFEGELLEDLLVVGAGALFFRPTRGGGVFEVTAVDAATIRPRVDAFGWPGPDEKVYEQWVMGLQVATFTRKELAYEGLSINARSYSPYPASPVEWLVNAINSALRADQWNQAWLTDGTTPDDLIAVPEGWSPGQVQSWQEYWDAMLAGNTRARRGTKFVPAGSNRVGSPTRKDQDFAAFELWLLRRTCSVMGVQPASIGYGGEQYKVSQEGSMEATSAFGVGVLLDWRKARYDDLLRRLGYPGLECRNVTGQEEKAAERATRVTALVAGAVLTPNEARQEEGLDPMEGGDVLLVPTTLRPLEQALEPPAPPPVPGQAPGGGSDEGEEPGAAQRRALLLWERKALNRLRAGKPARCGFQHAEVGPELVARVEAALAGVDDADGVRAVFRAAEEVEDIQ